jgi:hypothetical protein
MTTSEIAVIVGTFASIVGMVVVLFKIAASVTGTQLSVKNIDLKMAEMNISLTNYESRLRAVEKQTDLNERDIKTAFLRIDEDRRELNEALNRVEFALTKGIDDIKENCKEIQAEKRKKVVG